MIIPPPVQRKHDLVRPYLADVALRVRDVVSGYCDSSGFAYLGRLKDSQSLSEKIETGRFAGWSELDDLFACSIVIPTLTDEPGVLAYLRSSFREVETRQRGSTQKDPAVFRFDSTRFIGALRPDSLPSGNENLLSVKFEIQIRSAFEHAWSVTTHAIAYKTSKIDWRHLRLAAQLRAAIEQLDQVVLGFEQTAAFIPEQPWPDVLVRQRIRGYFEEHVASGLLPSEAVPSSWGRFCENLQRLIFSSSEKRSRDQVALVETALGYIEVEIQATRASSFPRSISLLQFCAGALAKSGFLAHPPHRYTPLVTTELVNLFPASGNLGPGFNFEFGE